MLRLPCLFRIGFLIVCGFSAAGLSAGEENPAMPAKMCWAHFCGWGFNVRTSYDDPDAFARWYDRTLLGQEAGTDLGVTSSRREQILEAMRYGIDGFCVDVPRLDGYGSLATLYRGAEGLPFKISLCVDGWSGPVSEVVAALADFLEHWGRHPNNYFIDGRPVIFIYRHGRSTDDCREILRLLAERDLSACWLVQPQRETGLWSDAEKLDAELSVFDGLYDFGVNGFTREQMIGRLDNGRRALERSGHGGLLCAGISQGYLGPHNGFYRPYFGTGTLRDNWAAAVASHADWVCLCTWNDFIETTHFEPSVWGRDVMLKLNAEYVRVWRGSPCPNRPPKVFVAYKEEATLGDDWLLELTSLPYTTDPARCGVRILDAGGKTVRDFGWTELPSQEQMSRTLCLEAPGLAGPCELRIQTAITGMEEAEPNWTELYPVQVRPGGMRAWRTLRLDLTDVLPSPVLTASDTPEGVRLTARFRSWSWWGQAELLRNGIEIARQDIAKFGPIETSTSFLVTPADRRTPRDCFVVRFTRHDRCLAFTPPVFLGNCNYGEERISLPVLVRGTDFDEGWGPPNWRRPWRLEKPVLEEIRVPEQEIWRVVLPLDRDSGDECRDIGGWHVRARRGVNGRWGSISPDLQPQWQTAEAGGQVRTILRFDGENDNVTFPFRTLPPGALTAELIVRPAKTAAMTVFSDQNEGLDVRLDEAGRAVAQRQKVQATASQPLVPDRWYHLAVVYDYLHLRVYVNGAEAVAVETLPQYRGINSRPILGALCREGRPLSGHFCGDLAGFALTARPLPPEEFILHPPE